MRWWIYQKERFPLMQHGPLVAAFSSCAVVYAAMITGKSPVWQEFVIAFISCLLFFLQLRIADEFKDAAEDTRYRPYRAVPRGLVKLRELGWVFVGACLIQFSLAFFYERWLVVVLLIGWFYLALMSVEFFARDWLKARPITYLWTHMLIMPIVDLYATACHWLPHGDNPGGGLGFFLAASFANGLVIELGRKLRQPEGEEEGVPTYSKLWGLKRAAWVWYGCLVTTAIFAVLAAVMINFVVPVSLVMGAMLIWALKYVLGFRETKAKTFELIAGCWTLGLYLTLGVIPWILR